MASTLTLIGQSPLLRLGMEAFSKQLDVTTVSYFSLEDFISDSARTETDSHMIWLDFISPVEDFEHLSRQIVALCDANPSYKIIGFCRIHYLEHLCTLSQCPQISLISNQENLVALDAYTALALKGERVVSPKMAAELHKFQAIRSTIRHALTQGEIQVLARMCDGMNFRNISRLSGQDAKTVSAHKRSAMRKLGVANDIELFKLRSRYFKNIDIRNF